MAESSSCSDSLERIPQNIYVSYFPNAAQISKLALDKALNIFTQGFIHEIKILYRETAVQVSARCFPSMKKSDTPHTVCIEIDVLREKLIDGHCSCKTGLSGHCAHVVGLVKTLQGLKLHNFSHVPDRQSCTSIPQQWSVPRGTTIKPVPINHVVVARPCESRKRKPVICQVDTTKKVLKITEDEVQCLQDLKGTPLANIIKLDVPTTDTVFGEVQIGSMLSYQSKNTREAIQEPASTTENCGNLSVNRVPPVQLPPIFSVLNTNTTHADDPVKMEQDTRQQADSELWYRARKYRLTASNFGRVLSRKAIPNDKFLESIFGSKPIHAKSLDYGKRHENEAKDEYLKHYPARHFHQCGFIVNNDFSFLGATPDGKICDQGESGIVEVKCPYAARNHTILEAIDKIDKFYLQKNAQGLIKLDHRHAYYKQIQGQLMISGCQFCEFFVYTQKDLFVERVFPDVECMTVMLEKLSIFYRDYVLPFFAEKKVKCLPHQSDNANRGTGAKLL